MGCGCGKRAQKALEVADRHGIPLPGPVRRHFERTAKKAEDEPRNTTTPDGKRRRVTVRQGADS